MTFETHLRTEYRVSVPSAPTPLAGVGAPRLNIIIISTSFLNILVYIHQNYQRAPVESIQKKGTGSSLISTKDACVEELPG